MSLQGRSAGAFTTDRALVVRSWDAWLADVTGLSEGEACGRHVGELFPGVTERGLLGRLQHVAATGVVEVIAPAFHEFFFACTPREPSAHFAHMQQLATIAPLRAGEEIIGVSVAIQDVTARREHERELAAQLGSADVSVRLAAVRELAREDGATAPLAAALGDESWQVRREAAAGLAHSTDLGTAQALVETLRHRHRDPAVLNATLVALAHAQPAVVPALIALLDAPDSTSEVRTYAALALGLIGARAAVPALLRRLKDADPNVSFHAIEALGRIGAREAAEPLSAVAESRDFDVAFAALDALALIGEPGAASRLVPLLDDPLLQPAVIDALAAIGTDEVVGAIVELLRRAPEQAPSLAPALAAIHERLEASHGAGVLVADLVRPGLTGVAERALIAALAGASGTKAERLATLLAWRGTETADAALASLLTRGDVRRTATRLLVARGTDAVPPLIAMLAADDDEACKGAAFALGQIGSAAAVPALVALLDAAPEVAVAAAGALGSIGHAEAFEPLLAQLDHPHPAVRQACVAALDSLGHPQMPARVRELLAHPSPRVRESAAKIAGYFGYADCVLPLVALCGDADGPVRRVAVEQLAALDDPAADAALAAALADGSADVRAAAARALAHTDSPDALRRLLAAAGDWDPWVRYYAVRSLGRHGRSEAIPVLTGLATGDPCLPVRVAAVEALGETGAAVATTTLGSLATDRETSVAVAALTALARLPGDDVLAILLGALQRGEPECRTAALTALGALGERGASAAVPAVARIATAGDDPAMRETALQVLGTIATEPAVAALVELTAEPQRSAAAVATLAGLGERQVPWVGRGLTHPDVEVRLAVADALGRMRSRSALRFLSAALDDPVPAVRRAAAAALRRVDAHDAHDAHDARLHTQARPAAEPRHSRSPDFR